MQRRRKIIKQDVITSNRRLDAYEFKGVIRDRLDETARSRRTGQRGEVRSPAYLAEIITAGR